jgi:hypothetical protein
MLEKSKNVITTYKNRWDHLSFSNVINKSLEFGQFLKLTLKTKLFFLSYELCIRKIPQSNFWRSNFHVYCSYFKFIKSSLINQHFEFFHYEAQRCCVWLVAGFKH